MSRLEGKKHWLIGSPSRRDIEAKPRKSNSGRFIGQRRAGALLPKESSIIALCEKLLGSVGILLTQGQGRQVQKLPEMSKNSKTCNLNSTTMLSMMG
jgi:hypothetical protein